MKNIKYYITLLCVVLYTTSCKDWLDVNIDPDAPNNKSALVANRLPWIQKFYMYSAGVTNMRTACQAGVYYSNNANNNHLGVTWACQAGSTTTPYQTWFVSAAANLNDLYNTAQEEGAYHYMAAANVMHTLGFMQMLDLYGEMPYTEALGASPSPAYDNGKTIFNGCIAKLDEAIELFNRTQEITAANLSSGDIWNGGDVNKWLKLCYGLKARYLLKLSKKNDLYNPDAILDCLTKAPLSNNDNTLAHCYNSSSDVTDYLYGDPIMTNGNWDYAAYGSNQRISKYYYDLLTNMRGSEVEDPRMTKIVPASMSNIRLDAGNKVREFEWLRSEGVDIYGDATRLVAGGATSIQLPNYADVNKEIKYTIDDDTDRAAFIASLVSAGKPHTVSGNDVTVTYKAGSLYINSTSYKYAGDTVYINLRNNSVMTGNADLGEMDMNWYFTTESKAQGAVGSTGSFQVRPNSDQEILTYHEMCFIKSEVYMRKGDKDNAHKAYIDGIKAHIDMMQAKLTEWKSAGYSNPDMWPMDESAITAYLASDAVCQDAGNLTMSDIMLQKYLAMGCSVENWNDMRRFNYSTGNIDDFGIVYPGYDRSPLFAGQAQIIGSSKTDPTYWMRRWRLPDRLELQYNSTNAKLANANALESYIWSCPVWWDCATDDEYFSYIQSTLK
ncbi:MAG: SusD/RagB family nutrient-binding outer membrane lipoprotein [Proteiniphilum sp.]|uniref:SusD/RagB family nutrient-binding outer membrane lipoprotein n=1 Tax=Proteiniphilum sp. TaxID=1926877 RepID=UPI002ABC7671|nr:SusD/RagB family nutrient-binding outer membrane lipoprotein [Proteiniphilum sp.]MDY9919324.1 SusD/RagB family nutrient-binding outer membrane lipoprotein [Proteiniphilum sp.]